MGNRLAMISSFLLTIAVGLIAYGVYALLSGPGGAAGSSSPEVRQATWAILAGGLLSLLPATLKRALGARASRRPEPGAPPPSRGD